MGQCLLIIGESGTGKTSSLRNFERGEVTYINVSGKAKPFKGHFENEIVTDSCRKIKQVLKEMKTDIAVIDDSQYLMANEFMRRAEERGYDKFTEIAKNYWELITMVSELGFNKRVYFLSHLETGDDGRQKVKTIGKMLDDKITVEGLFTVVLKTKVQDGKYSFLTQNNGRDTVKSPMGMFPANEIPNDLKAVDNAVVAFYELDDPFITKDERPAETPVAEAKEEPKQEEPKAEEPKQEEQEQPHRTRRVRKER